MPAAPAEARGVPLVSVGMLAYRHEAYLAQAIESVLAQECDFAFELIIGEDRSPDRSLEIARAYEAAHPGIVRVLTSETNVGMQENSLRCLRAARGEFMAYCEGDDFWSDPTKLARQVAIFRERSACALVFHAATTVDVHGGRGSKTGPWSPHARLFSPREVVLGDGGLIPTASMMVRRETVLDTIPGWAARAVVPDYALALWAACVGEVAYIPRSMSVYRTNVADSWSMRQTRGLAPRLAHARRVHEMLDAFVQASPVDVSDAAATMVSKYYSDALVRSAPDGTDAMEAYRELAGRMRHADRALAWLAARAGLRLPMAKSLLRKAATLRRLAASVRSDRILPS